MLTFFFSTSRMRWLISFRYADFLNTSSLQDLITLFMDSRMPITTWRSCSVRTFSTKQGITTSSSFRSAGEEKANKQKNYNPSCNDVCFFYMSLSATVYSFTVGPHHQTISVPKKEKHVHSNSFTLVVVLCGTIFPCLVLSSAKLAHCSKCCSANVVMGILRI